MWAKVRRLSGRWVVNLLVGVCLITIVAYVSWMLILSIRYNAL